MKVGILEFLTMPSQSLKQSGANLFFSKQYASITPQAISFWCRQLGHKTYYATYYGIGKLEKKLPDDLDIVFISACSQFAQLAYSLAKLYRKSGVKTVIGGPHAKSFPQDCLRFFDIVVSNLDKALLNDILLGHIDCGTSISSSQPYIEIPSVEERLPEIRKSAYFKSRWPSPLMSVVPVLSSLGCPYQCNFCTDWNNPYKILPADRLIADVKAISQYLPGAFMGFSDPNFAVKFDYVINALESIPKSQRIPYGMQCSLSILNQSRMQRMRETGCIVGLFGLESWYDFDNKAGVSRKSGAEAKLEKTIAMFEELNDCIGYTQVNFIFGVDSDKGNEPIELTKEFMRRIPDAWHNLSMPIPFGGTPMYDDLLNQGRILSAMPFSFYFAPFLVMQPKNYSPIEYAEKFYELSSFLSSDHMLKLRVKNAKNFKYQMLHRLRTMVEKEVTRFYGNFLEQLRQDKKLLAFHEGRSKELPDFYRQQRQRLLGRYFSLLSEQDWIPELTYQEPVIV